MNDWNSSVRFPINTPVATKTSQSLHTAPTISNKLAAKTGITKSQGLPLCLVIFPIVPQCFRTIYYCNELRKPGLHLAFQLLRTDFEAEH